jgi:diguanylate cyclase (GGDEF)-like protein
MKADRIAPENERLIALDRYDALDTPSELSFDRITRIASNALDVPMAAVSLIDNHRQWFKSRQGPLDEQTCRSEAFCNVTIQRQEPLIVEDAAADPRFKDSALVVGPPHIRFYAGVPLCTPDGYNLGALCVIDTKPRQLPPRHLDLLKDLAEMVMSAFEARRMAGTDSLTGAQTRGGFREAAERALALSYRHSNPLSCIVLDLDHFKTINDTHGHAIGDRVLFESAKTCRERLRISDILGRIGGEEFAIILPHTDATAAMHVAEDIRVALEQLVVVLPFESLKVSASFGIASRDRAEMTLDELLRRADVALYEAKHAGRNTCVAWNPPPGHASADGIRRVLKAGQIVFNAGRSVIDCTVRGLGDAAARLDVMNTAGIPDRFKLAITGDNFSRACQVTAKQNVTLEVAFV